MRYFVGFFVTIFLIILIIVLLLRGGGTATPAPKAINLGDYANNVSSAQLILDSPIVADQNHREIKLIVSESAITFTEYKGYQQDVIKSQTYPNNPSSYGVFLQAIQKAGFTEGSRDKALQDERGYCPGGYRYIYSFANGADDLFRTWSTSCGSQGTFKGQPSTIRQLFQKQVPDYFKLSSDFNI